MARLPRLSHRLSHISKETVQTKTNIYHMIRAPHQLPRRAMSMAMLKTLSQGRAMEDQNSKNLSNTQMRIPRAN